MIRNGGGNIKLMRIGVGMVLSGLLLLILLFVLFCQFFVILSYFGTTSFYKDLCTIDFTFRHTVQGAELEKVTIIGCDFSLVMF